jgi:hypothetical protein
VLTGVFARCSETIPAHTSAAATTKRSNHNLGMQLGDKKSAEAHIAQTAPIRD